MVGTAHPTPAKLDVRPILARRVEDCQTAYGWDFCLLGPPLYDDDRHIDCQLGFVQQELPNRCRNAVGRVV